MSSNITCENEEHSIVKFTFTENFDAEDFKKFLGILSTLLNTSEETNKPFGFYIDSRAVVNKPYNALSMLVSWMRKHRQRIKEKKMLKASSVCITSNIIARLINTAFRIQPTVSPNLITTNIEDSKKFVENIMKEV